MVLAGLRLVLNVQGLKQLHFVKLNHFAEEYLTSIGLTPYLLPYFGGLQSASNSAWFVSIFTVTSFVRGYLTRRFFNYLTIRKYNQAV